MEWLRQWQMTMNDYERRGSDDERRPRRCVWVLVGFSYIYFFLLRSFSSTNLFFRFINIAAQAPAPSPPSPCPLLSSSAKLQKLQVLSKEKKPTHQTRYWVQCPSTTTNMYRKDLKRAGKGRNAGLEMHLEPCQWYFFFFLQILLFY